MAAGKGYKSYARQSRVSQRGSIGDHDPEGQSRGYDKQFLPYCRYGGIVNCFEQSDRLAVHVGEGLHPHSVSLYMSLNYMLSMQIKQTVTLLYYTKFRVAFFFLA